MSYDQKNRNKLKNKTMADGVQAALVIGVMFYGTLMIIRTFIDARLKRRVIDKSDVNTQALDALASTDKTDKFPTLKWGLVAFFGGFGLVIVDVLNAFQEDSPLGYGIVLIFVAAGFLIYYMIVKSQESKQQ
ncbi:MAG TPA: hypothetical protein DDY13_01200 [Cytophagales bacterium]|nr:hypothetical protein [Cytophagales bacterium]